MSSLPHPSTRLVGRAAQLGRLRELIQHEPLISLTGPPGSGKTRLGIEVGRTVAGAFRDGAWFVPLAPIQDPGLIAHAVARTLSLTEDPGTPMPELVGRHLAGRELLLILDNFEHVLDGATVVPEWLALAPELRVIATSRAALRLTAEHVFEVPPLAVPVDPDDPAAASSDAVQLFNERARAVTPEFESDEQTLAGVARICRRLDGLPLALELAAARTKALPVPAILSRLEHSLELLTYTARDVPERHRSLHAAVSWSYGLLTPAEGAFLRRLSVFRAGWTLEAADAVTLASAELGSDPLSLTTSLLDESLIRRQSEVRIEPRYDMLETLREYGLERLSEAGEAEDVAARHAAWFLDLADRAAPLLTGKDRGVWLDRLEREGHNFSAAMRWTIDRRQVELGMRLGAALWRFWQIRAHLGEGRQLLAELLALEADVDPAIRARALSAAGSLAYWQNDSTATIQLYESSVKLRRSGGDQAELASGLYDLGHALSVMEPVRDIARGRALELEALAIYQSLGDRIGEAWLTWALGCNLHHGGDSAAGFEHLYRSVELFRGLGDQFGLAWALTMGALAATALGQDDVAKASWREALRIFVDVDDVSGIYSVLEHLARLEGASGDPRRAIRLAAAAARVRGVSDSAIVVIANAGVASALERVRLGPDEIEAVGREGEMMSTAEAVAYALAEEPERADAGLRVHALGPTRVERYGVPIDRWGGDKAGSRQAKAIFAFLFDRGPAGIAKDEATELIWPDLEIRRGDLAFHRTLGGLRSVLAEGLRGGEAITYEGGRYRLAPNLVTWSDAAAFEELIGKAAQSDAKAATDAREQARRLYRGDWFDDCPLYGDSSYVEERRAYLRGLFEDVLTKLGDHYRDHGDQASAAARYRQALGVNPENRTAISGLERLGAAAAETV